MAAVRAHRRKRKKSFSNKVFFCSHWCTEYDTVSSLLRFCRNGLRSFFSSKFFGIESFQCVNLH